MKTNRPKLLYHCRALRTGAIVLLAALAAYVAWIQLAASDDLLERSKQQQTMVTFVPAKRGSIIDRNAVVLNSDQPEYDIALRIEKIRDPRDTRTATINKVSARISELGALLGPNAYQNRPTKEQILKHLKQNAPLPFTIWKKPTKEVLTRLAANKHNFPEVELVLSWNRTYEFPKSATHIRGFASHKTPIDQDETIKQLNARELVGQTGIELACNDQLRGSNGFQIIHTDVFTYRYDTVKTQQAIPGNDVALTIDIKLQQTAEEQLLDNDLSGAIVIMDAQNGEIFALASCPAFTLPPTQADSQIPGAFVNRAIAGFYPPGSTIKPLFAIAALQKKVITPSEPIYCPGYYQLTPTKTVACSAKDGHGYVTLPTAIALSCNTYFCEVGRRLGKSGVNEIAPYIGFGKSPNTILWRHEKAGIAFTPDWVSKHRKDSVWHLGDAVNAAIGQGEWIVTPLQMAVYTCAITTGRIFTPRLIISRMNQIPETFELPPDIATPIKVGMLGCTQYGTGKALQIPGIDVLAKTGTADHAPNQKPHAWAIAALPASDPKIIGVCIVESAGGGGRIAAPLLKNTLLHAIDRMLPTTIPQH